MSLVSIIIPTWNNPNYLIPCVNSILRYTAPDDLFHIYIVNNGDPEHGLYFKDHPYITVIQMKENVGWEGGLEAGLQASNEPYVLFLNDDTAIMSHQRFWLMTLLNHFTDEKCAAVGPTSNVVMGRQNIFYPMDDNTVRARFLIGFCMLLRRKDIVDAGGIDRSLPGGDDLDISIRLRKLGKYLLIDRNVFVYHYGFKTGERLEGKPTEKDGWNSPEKIEKTNHALINKHGIRAFLDLWVADKSETVYFGEEDSEGNIIRGYINGENIVELGCGDHKTVPNSIGVDIIPKGIQIPGVARGRLSVADVIADVEKDIIVSGVDTIIARHVLEHVLDSTKTVNMWRKSLKDGGRLIVAVPDSKDRNTIPMNWEHKHAWTPESLKNFMESLGWHTEALEDAKNNVSFVGVFKANGLQ